MKLYVIRHGESETNKKGVWTGWLDPPLTERGLCDAERAGKLISGIKFDKLYSSDLIRARKTCEIALNNAPYEITPTLREVDVGWIAGKPLTILTDEMRASMATRGFAEFGGESVEQFNSRIKEFMDLAVKSGAETVAAFAHAGILRSMLGIILGTTVPKQKIRCTNCAVAIFEYSNGSWYFYGWTNAE